MNRLFRDIDLLLRGQFTQREDLRAGKVLSPVRTLVLASFLLGALYGVFMGLYSVMRSGGANWAQLVAATFKVPLLFLLTLLVTFPSLYVFSALARSRLAFPQTVRVLLAAITVDLAVLASFGPVTGFFTLSTDSYPFMILLNVLFFGISGLIGIGFLRKALDAVFDAPPPEAAAPPPAPPPVSAEGSPGAAAAAADARYAELRAATLKRDRPTRVDAASAVFRIWAVIFGVVGAQMGWILRPFVGTPTLPFELFRPRASNFFVAVLGALRNLLT
jgi:hypothetical protein